MAQDGNSDHTLLGIGIGIIIGSLFAFLILRERQAPAAPQTQAMPAIDASIFRQFIEDIQRLSEENAMLKYQLSRPLSVSYPVPAPATETRVVETPKSPQAPAPIESTAYKNNERWEIDRSKDGSIKGIKVMRDVKVDGTAGAAG